MQIVRNKLHFWNSCLRSSWNRVKSGGRSSSTTSRQSSVPKTVRPVQNSCSESAAVAAADVDCDDVVSVVGRLQLRPVPFAV